jgi:hypothetical protein
MFYKELKMIIKTIENDFKKLKNVNKLDKNVEKSKNT